MALFKPEVITTNGFNGICECNIVQINDKSDMFDWADIYLEVQLLQNGSKYTRNASIVGGFEKDASGNITGGSVIKRMYTFFAAINCHAGINIKGEWEEADGKKINSISDYLNSQFTTEWDGESNGSDGKYLAYFYKQQPKKPGDKAYGRAHYKLYPAGGDNKNKLQNDIDWMKSKGYIKEATETETVMTVDADDLGSLALDNL
jgi:hypothetical protein